MTKRGAGRTSADAKARPDTAIGLAPSDVPQVVTPNGREAGIASAEMGERKTERQGSLAMFLAASPLRGSGIQIERLRDGPRELDL